MNACPSVVNQPNERCILVLGTLDLAPNLPQDEGIQIEKYIRLVLFEKNSTYLFPSFLFPCYASKFSELNRIAMFPRNYP